VNYCARRISSSNHSATHRASGVASGGMVELQPAGVPGARRAHLLLPIRAGATVLVTTCGSSPDGWRWRRW
jgi:hypothetical protein